VAGNVKIEKIQSIASRVNSWLPALLAFFLPLSTSAVSVLAVLILVLWLVEGRFSEKLAMIIRHPVSLAVLLFLAVLMLGLSWSPDIEAGFEVIRHRWMLWLLPVFVTAIRGQRRRLYVNAFLAGLVVAMGVTFLAWFDLIHYADVTPTHLTRKTFHVVYNPMLAFGIYLVLHEVLRQQGMTVRRCALSVLAAVMILDMFITEGRTGQLVFFVLMGLLLFQVFGKHRGKALLAICLLLPLTFAAGYRYSPVFQQRVDTACREVRQFRENPDTSIGMRLLFWQNSWEIIRQHPWLGVGTGGFQAAYAQVNRRQSPDSVATDNPHNQYVLVMTMVGIPGMLALCMIFAALFRQAAVLDDIWQRVRYAFPVFFLTIMLTESYLKVYETGFLFSLFAAVLFSSREIPGEKPFGAGV
jgi:O-antigen ligase